MKRKVVTIVGLLLLAAAYGNIAEATTESAADGLLQFSPPQSVSCVALRVEVPEGKMVTGLRWYNGTDTESFAHILVASGNDFEPPALSEAVALAEGVVGENNAWSEADFSSPIASQSGTLFIVMEYPADYAPEPGQPILGVGYANESSPNHYFVTGNGIDWYRVTSRCRVLLEPILEDRIPGVEEKSRGQVDTAEEKLGLFAAPNPFNPSTRIDLYLPAITTGKVRIMDIRGYVVTELYSGAFAKGQNSFVWQGQDRGGRAVASGVYWILAETSDQRLLRKVLLVK